MTTELANPNAVLAFRRAELEAAESEVAAATIAAAAAKATLRALADQAVDGRGESIESASRRGEYAGWSRRRDDAAEALGAAEARLPDLERRRREAAHFVDELEAERAPDIDDAIEGVHRTITSLEDQASLTRAEIDQAKARLVDLEVDAALGADVAAERSELAEAIRAGEGLVAETSAELERTHALVDGLIRRRASYVSERARAASAAGTAAWVTAQAAAEAAAQALREAGSELIRIRDEAPGVRVDVWPSPEYFDAIVERVAGWRLRDPR